MTITWSMLFPVIVAIIAFLFGSGIAVISYFVRKELDTMTKRVETLEGKKHVEKSDLDEVYEDIEGFKKEIKEKLRELDKALVELERKLDAAARSSVTDDHESKAGILQKIEELRREFNDHRLQVNTWTAAAGERYVSRSDFIKDSTQLDTKISGVHRSIRGMEDSISNLLKNYLKAP